jgi:hypothetical protein
MTPVDVFDAFCGAYIRHTSPHLPDPRYLKTHVHARREPTRVDVINLCARHAMLECDGRRIKRDASENKEALLSEEEWRDAGTNERYECGLEMFTMQATVFVDSESTLQ